MAALAHPRPTHPPHLSTEDLAQSLKITPGTIRTRLCRTGSYFGLRPLKLPNGRLLWPGDAVERLTKGATNSAARAGE
jgi:hypothetical protein